MILRKALSRFVRETRTLNDWSISNRPLEKTFSSSSRMCKAENVAAEKNCEICNGLKWGFWVRYKNKFGQLIDASFRPIFQLNSLIDRRTNSPTFLYRCNSISVMFLGLPDKIHEEKPSFLQSKKNALRKDRRTDWPMDGPMDRHPLIEMQGRI